MNKLKPITTKDLYDMISRSIYSSGNHCSLNHIDISLITDMSYLFSGNSFDGDLSEWDVSHVRNMAGMFQSSKFTGDISNWNVSSVQNMSYMFRDYSFHQSLECWKPISLQQHQSMFDNSFIIKPLWFYDDIKLIRNHFKKMNLQKTLQHQLINNNHDLSQPKL